MKIMEISALKHVIECATICNLNYKIFLEDNFEDPQNETDEQISQWSHVNFLGR